MRPNQSPSVARKSRSRRSGKGERSQVTARAESAEEGKATGEGGGHKGTGPAGDKLGKGKGPGVASTQTRKKLLKEISSDKALRAVFDALLAEKGAKATDEALRRFVALKPYIARHKEALDKLLVPGASGEVTDPIKHVIEPHERIPASSLRFLQQDLRATCISKSPFGKGEVPNP